MKLELIHENHNVLDLEKSLAFYEEAVGLKEIRRRQDEDGSFISVYLANDLTDFELELTWKKDREDTYDVGDIETHIAFIAENFDEAYKFHRAMGCVCGEDIEKGIYFIKDPDGYLLEVANER